MGQILKEALRLWPTAPAFGLYPYQNETIGEKYKLRKRTFVTVLTAMLHRDKSVWGPQAEVFNPDNFAPEREAKMPPHAYKPFGNGGSGTSTEALKASLVGIQRGTAADPHGWIHKVF